MAAVYEVLSPARSSTKKLMVRGLACDRLMQRLGTPLQEDAVWAVCYQCCKHLLDMMSPTNEVDFTCTLALGNVIISVEGDVFISAGKY